MMPVRRLNVREADAQGHAGGHHLRQRREDRDVHRRRRDIAAAPARPEPRWLLRGRTLLWSVPEAIAGKHNLFSGPTLVRVL